MTSVLLGFLAVDTSSYLLIEITVYILWWQFVFLCGWDESCWQNYHGSWIHTFLEWDCTHV